MVVKLYVSGISGNKEVKKKQQRVQMILDSKSISYEAIDITEPGKEKDKETMQGKAKVREALGKHPLPPQIFNEEEYCGDYEDFDLANEVDQLEAFLHLPLPSKLSADTEIITSVADKVNGSRENSEIQNGEENRTEMNGHVELTPLPADDGTSHTSSVSDVVQEKEDGDDDTGGDVIQPDDPIVDNRPSPTSVPDLQATDHEPHSEPQTEEIAQSEDIDEEATNNDTEVDVTEVPVADLIIEDVAAEKVCAASLKNDGSSSIVPIDGSQIINESVVLRDRNNSNQPTLKEINLPNILTDSIPYTDCSKLIENELSQNRIIDANEIVPSILIGQESEQNKSEFPHILLSDEKELCGQANVLQFSSIENEFVAGAEDFLVPKESTLTTGSSGTENIASEESILKENKSTESAALLDSQEDNIKPVVSIELGGKKTICEEASLPGAVSPEEPILKENKPRESTALLEAHEDNIKPVVSIELGGKKTICEEASLPGAVSPEEPILKENKPRESTALLEAHEDNIKPVIGIELGGKKTICEEALLPGAVPPEEPILKENKSTESATLLESHEDIIRPVVGIDIGNKKTIFEEILLSDTVTPEEPILKENKAAESTVLLEAHEENIRRDVRAELEESLERKEFFSLTAKSDYSTAEKIEPLVVITEKSKIGEVPPEQPPVDDVSETQLNLAVLDNSDVKKGCVTEKHGVSVCSDQIFSGVQLENPCFIADNSVSEFVGGTNFILSKSEVQSLSSATKSVGATCDETDEELDQIRPLVRRDTLKYIKRPSLPLTKSSPLEETVSTKIDNSEKMHTRIGGISIKETKPSDGTNDPGVSENDNTAPQHHHGVPTKEIMVDMYEPHNIDRISYSPQLVAHHKSDKPPPKPEERGVSLRNWDRRPSEIDVVKEVRTLLDERDTDLAIGRARARAGLPQRNNPHRQFIDQMNKLIEDIEKVEETVDYPVVHPLPPPKKPSPPPPPPLSAFMQEVLLALNGPPVQKDTLEPENVFLSQVKTIFFTKQRGATEDSEFVENVREVLNEREHALGIAPKPRAPDHSEFLGDMMLLLGDEPIIKDQEDEKIEIPVKPAIVVASFLEQTSIDPTVDTKMEKSVKKSREEKKPKEKNIEVAQIFIRDNVFPIIARVTTENYKIFISSLDSSSIELTTNDVEALTITVVEDNQYKSDVAKIVVSPSNC